MPPPTEQSLGHNASKPITSFFMPAKQPESSSNRPKIAVKSALKSNNLPTFSSKTSAFKPPPGPFSLNRNDSRSSSTDSLTKHLAKFALDTKSKKTLIDLDAITPKSEKSETTEETTDGSDLDELPVKRVLRRRKPTKKIATYIFSSDDEVEEENDATDIPIKKRKRNIFDSDDDEDMDEIMDDAVDEAYVDTNEQINKAYDAKIAQTEIERVKNIMPEKSYEEIRQAIRQAGSLVGGSHLLMMRKDSTMKPKRPRIMDDETLMERKQKELSDMQRDRLVLKYFNTCTAKDLQDVTGCKQETADKIIEELRPFDDIDDLENKLRRTKGTSAKFIDRLQEMMDGYTAVDQVIEGVEDLGSELRNVLKIWEELEAETTQRDASPVSQEDGGDETAGIHLCKLDIDLVRDKSSPEYKDAMEGYLVQQPEIVNKEMTLKDYQILGINWMLLLYRKGISGILADEMGLGKTAQVISFLGRLYELGKKGPHLIVVPSSTIENWAREFERFCPTLEVRIYHGSMKERCDMRYDLKEERKLNGFQVIITTYQLAAGHIDDRKFLKKLFCRSMILDEGHMVKNCSSSRYKALMSINTPFRLLLTGTPLQNNLQELVSLLTFIMPNTFSDNEEAIRSVFKIRNTATSSSDSNKNEASIQILSKARIERAKRMMTPFLLRRKKQDVLKDLPQKIQVVEHCAMTKNQAAVYSDIITNTKKSYEKSLLETDEPRRPKSAMTEQFENMSNVIVHLRKAADHPLLFRKIYNNDLLRKMTKEIRRDVKYWDTNEEYVYEDMTVMSDFELHKLCQENKTIKQYQLQNEEWMDSGKIEKLKKLLPQFKKQGNKVLIFSQFTKVLDILELAMDTMGTSFLRLDGDTKVMERQDIIDEFNEDEDIQVFLLSTKAGGFGINLTSANIVILYDLDFNPQNDKQAEDRAHRVGQTKDVTVYRLIAKDSIEEYVLKMADMKLRLDMNISAKEGDVLEGENNENQKQSLQSMIKEAFHMADAKFQQGYQQEHS